MPAEIWINFQNSPRGDGCCSSSAHAHPTTLPLAKGNFFKSAKKLMKKVLLDHYLIHLRNLNCFLVSSVGFSRLDAKVVQMKPCLFSSLKYFPDTDFTACTHLSTAWLWQGKPLMEVASGVSRKTKFFKSSSAQNLEHRRLRNVIGVPINDFSIIHGIKIQLRNSAFSNLSRLFLPRR